MIEWNWIHYHSKP